MKRKLTGVVYMSFIFGLALLLTLYDMLYILSNFGWTFEVLGSKAFVKDVLLAAIVAGYFVDLYLRRRGCYKTQKPYFILLAAYCIVVWAL